MLYRSVSLAILFILAFSVASTFASEPAPAEQLSALIEYSLANNPELKSSEARWKMFASKAKQASALEDPMLMFKLQNMVARYPTSFSKDPTTAKVVGISQQIPFWGKRSLKEEIATLEAESYRYTIEERKLELRRMVTETYYQLYTTDKALSIISKNLRLLDDFVTIAESRYSVGQGAQQDLFKAGLEKSKMLDMQITLQQQRNTLASNLNYLLYRPANTPVGTIAEFNLPKIAYSAEQLNRLAAENRPQVKSLTLLADKGRAAHRLAEKEYYPDFNLSFEYMFREASMNDPGYNMFTVGLTFNLPFQMERRRAMVAESAAESSMSTEELNALKNSIGFQVNDLLGQLERRRKLTELYKGGIIPQAEQSLESAVISYRVGKVDFMTLLDGRINLFNYEREYHESMAEYMMKLAQLEALVGTSLTTTASGNAGSQGN